MAAALSSVGWICPPTPTPTRCHSTTPRVRCSPRPPPPPTTPWLVLPPEERAYKFYSVAEDRVLTLKKKEDGTAAPPRNALLVGSSHGWLALLDKESDHVFLSNPISGRHLRLPSRPGKPKRVILSSSPDDDDVECYAVLDDYLNPAYCAVGAAEWTELAVDEDEGLNYLNLAYCSSRRALSLITHSSFEFDSGGVRVPTVPYQHGRSANHQIDYWDLRSNSRVETTWFWKFQGLPHRWKENEDGNYLTGRCLQELHLVYAATRDSPFIVVRFVRCEFGATGASAGFVVLEIDGDDQSIRVVDDLKGLALFIGVNHSFAIPAAGMLKPNSIYFAPASVNTGIFDYRSKTFSPFSPTSINIKNKCPMWFTPNPH